MNIELGTESKCESRSGVRRWRWIIVFICLPLLVIALAATRQLASKHAEKVALEFVRSKDGILGGGHSIVRLPIPGINRMWIGSVLISADQLTDEMVDHLQNIRKLSSVGLYHPSEHQQVMDHKTRKEDWIVIKSLDNLHLSLSSESMDQFEELISDMEFYVSIKLLEEDRN